ncbi:hypothetical protein [Treponema phagedenis]|uniref:DUF3575 domain-containing protein n=1 Tax=Treponema phagedenis TaxID=162 RepID=A0AAE6IX44_TREPH|nr:hypothetical protein [Treponema phagedenis]QEJ98937.1 hypothetical protein FUT82_13660 [Treponema phagedenis]QEK04445.1 hypothetical protein FUT83_11960 [Treponema phagedenis]QEK10100.1 hypothetical protein FUT81_12090 [Treponema phagedenis]
MKKRMLIIIASLFLFCSTAFAKIGIGPELGFSGTYYYYSGYIGLSLKLEKPNLVFTVMGGGGYWGGTLGLAVDYWFLNNKIQDLEKGATFNWYIGVGGKGAVNFFNYYGAATSAGGLILARMPVGFNFFVSQQKIEPYIQLALGLGVGFYPKYKYGRTSAYFAWEIPLSIGCRFWI